MHGGSGYRPAGARDRLVVEDGPIRVELLPAAGARLHRLRVFGHDLLRTPDDPALHATDPFLWGAYVMAPWCNRIAASTTHVGGQTVDPTPNSPEGSAIHGQVYARSWEVGHDGWLTIRGGGDGWPWDYESMIRVTTEERILRIEQALTNLAGDPMPAGLGIHPWFRRPIDVRIDAALALTSNIDPAAPLGPVSGLLDLRSMRPMPSDLDAAWLDPGDPAVELHWPGLEVAATLRLRSDAGRVIVAASPSGLDSVAIEAQTHLPQGLRRLLGGEPGGLIPLAPGATIRLETELAFEQRAPREPRAAG